MALRQRLFEGFFLLVALALIAALAFGCGKKEAGSADNTLHKYLKNDVPTLDPALISEIYGGTVAAHMFNGLVRFNDKMELIPDIAERWETSADGLSYTFHLREGVKFAGEMAREVAAADFKYSFERVLNPATAAPYTWTFDYVLGAEAFNAGKADEVAGFVVEDHRTLIIKLETPHAPFLTKLAMPTAFVVQREQVEKWGEDLTKHIMGTGPFMVDVHEEGHRILLKANPDYFEGRPALDAIEYRVIPQAMTQQAEFERGGIDLMGLEGTDYARYKKDPKYAANITEIPALSVHYLGFNTQRTPYDDARVRQAANYAVDRQAIVDALYDGRYTLATGSIPPVLAGHNASLKGYSYDLEKAKALLKEAGHEDGVDLVIGLRETPEAQELCEALQGFLEKAGFRVKLLKMEKSALYEEMKSGKLDAMYMSWLMDYPDAENFLYPLFDSSNFDGGGNRAKFSDAETDRLIEAARMESDAARRTVMYAEAEARVVEQAPWVFLWHPTDAMVRQPWVKGYRPYPIYYGSKGAEISIER